MSCPQSFITPLRPGLSAAGLVVAALTVLAPAAHAVTIAGTSFEEPGSLGGTDSLVVQVANGQVIPNQAGRQNRNYDGTLGAMTELTFTSTWFNTGPGGGNAEGALTGPSSSGTDGDEVGVETGNAGGLTPPDGLAFYDFDDTDGAIEVAFETVDLTGFNNIQLLITIGIASTDWETPDDGISLTVNGTTIYTTFGLDLDNAADFGLAEGTHTTLTFDSSDFGKPTSLALVVRASTSSGSEDITIDNIRITGDIPEPATATLLTLAAAPLLLRRRTA